MDPDYENNGYRNRLTLSSICFILKHIPFKPLINSICIFLLSRVAEGLAL